MASEVTYHRPSEVPATTSPVPLRLILDGILQLAYGRFPLFTLEDCIKEASQVQLTLVTKLVRLPEGGFETRQFTRFTFYDDPDGTGPQKPELVCRDGLEVAGDPYNLPLDTTTGRHHQTIPIGSLPPISGLTLGPLAAVAEGPVVAAAETPITGFVVTDNIGAAVPMATYSATLPITAEAFLNSIFLPGTSGKLYNGLVALLDDDTTVTGSDGADTIEVGAGNDTVNSRAGDDAVLKWKSGNLTYDGGAGSDSLSFSAEFSVATPAPFVQQLVVNLTTGVGTNPYGGSLNLNSVENIIGTPNADIITGNDDANIIGDAIVETAGDIIDAKGGDDIIGFFSLAGFVPSLPGARIDGGAGTDILFFQYDRDADFNGAPNVLDLANQANNTGMFRASTFANIERFVVGSAFATSFGSLDFRGDDGANDLSVRAGALTIDMRGGDDILQLPDALPSDPVSADGGTGNDRLVVRVGGILDLATPANNTRGLANGTFANFEIFESAPLADPALTNPLNQAFALDFRGNASAQTIIGSFENDTFLGRGGNDTLMGGIGADTYIYAPGDGNDTIIEDGLAAAILLGSLSFSQTDVLWLVGLNPTEVALTRTGNDLVVTLIATSETMRVTDHFLGGAKGIEQIQFAAATFSRQQILDNLVGGAPNASPVVAATLQSVALEDSGVQSVDLLTGATDANGDPLHVANVKGLVSGLTLIGDTLRIDRSDASFQSFNAGGNRSFNITYDIVDGKGGSVGQLARVFVTGVNDAAAIDGLTFGSVTKDGVQATDGVLSVIDIDKNVINGASEARLQLQTNAATSFGRFNVFSDGQWSYLLDNANPAVQALAPDQTLIDTIAVRSVDGTTANVTIVVKGSVGTPLPPTLAIAANDAAKPEGDSGTTLFTFTVTRSGDLSGASSVHYAVTGSGANPADAADFAGNALPSGDVSFAADETSKPITINVAADAAAEPDEGFTVTLSGATGANITTATATGTIRNDDSGTGPNLIVGTSGNDDLTGTSGNDDIRGLAGSDVLIGRGGADKLDAGDGNDIVWADALDTSLNGGTGYDYLLFTDSGPHTLALASAGFETIIGGPSADNFDLTGVSSDLLLIAWGMGGNDTIRMGASPGYAYGGVGDDTLLGGEAVDVLIGDAGADRISGGGGNDVLWVDGSDILDGGAGIDWAIILSQAGDSLVIGNNGIEVAAGNVGNDTIDTRSNTVGLQLWGGFGADNLYSGSGNDDFYGGSDGATDVFHFSAGWGLDQIWDFEDGIDRISVAEAGVTSLAQLSVVASGDVAIVTLVGTANQIYVHGAAGRIDAADFAFA